jgi:sphingolipid delta-4 desaturase
MGKGGCKQSTTNEEALLQKSSSSLEQERLQKISSSPHFVWSPTPEPHRIRKSQILSSHPSIKQYMGIDPSTKYKVLFWVFVQLSSLHLLQGASNQTWLFCCYTLSGSINHMMTLAMHELSHNLGSKSVFWNRILAIIANLPMGIPAAASFKRYHMEHHKYQGEDVLDVDIPTNAEGWFFHSTPRKIVWCLLQPLFYSLRPLFVNPKRPGYWEYINILCIVVFDACIVFIWGIKELLYLVVGTLFGMGLHPVAGHFIAEHYVMNEGQETYSYYGPLNWLTFNVGEFNCIVCVCILCMYSFLICMSLCLIIFQLFNTTPLNQYIHRIPQRTSRLCQHLRQTFTRRTQNRTRVLR